MTTYELTNPCGVTTVVLPDGRSLSYGESTTETGDMAEGFDWTRYGADGEFEAQDWARDSEQMAEVVAQFKRSA